MHSILLLAAALLGVAYGAPAVTATGMNGRGNQHRHDDPNHAGDEMDEDPSLDSDPDAHDGAAHFATHKLAIFDVHSRNQTTIMGKVILQAGTSSLPSRLYETPVNIGRTLVVYVTHGTEVPMRTLAQVSALSSRQAVWRTSLFQPHS